MSPGSRPVMMTRDSRSEPQLAADECPTRDRIDSCGSKRSHSELSTLDESLVLAFVWSDNLCLDGNQGQVLWFCSVERWSPGQVEVDIYVLCTIFED